MVVCKYLPGKSGNLTSLLGTQAKELSDVTCTCNPTVCGERGCRDGVNRKLMDLQAYSRMHSKQERLRLKKVETERPLLRSSDLTTGTYDLPFQNFEILSVHYWQMPSITEHKAVVPNQELSPPFGGYLHYLETCWAITLTVYFLAYSRWRGQGCH